MDTDSDMILLIVCNLTNNSDTDNVLLIILTSTLSLVNPSDDWTVSFIILVRNLNLSLNVCTDTDSFMSLNNDLLNTYPILTCTISLNVLLIER